MATNNKQQFPNDELESRTNSELDARAKALELEERELDLIIKRTQVAEIRAAQQKILDRNQASQASIAQFLAARKSRQSNCNHKKGGVGAEAVMRGLGQSSMYAVIKHKLPCGKYFVLCQRCGKEWMPELTALQNGGTPRKATKGYYDAVQMQTNNSESGSSMFTYSVAEPRSAEEDEE